MLVIFATDDSELAEMRVHHDRLRIGVADDAYAAVTQEFGELIVKFGSEIRTFEAVDGTMEGVAVESADTAYRCPKM